MSHFGHYVRLPLAALAAAVVTCSLFLSMYGLIMSGREQVARRDAISHIRFGRVEIPDEIVSRSRRKPLKPPPPGSPPPRPGLQPSRIEQPVRTMPRLELPKLAVPQFGGKGPFIGHVERMGQQAEGDVIPVVVIRPIYPRDAAISGTEGWVKVEFTITETGAVRDPHIIDAQPPRVFNREAIRAIQKWKFKPRVVDGVAVERRATQVIDFSLDDWER